ncbi:MAG: DNA polymerase I, partial [Candidatus Pacebacteria bacterium]|nr:DNA polymerase I [Candidatus Paceibacterota bacterium]
CLFEDIKILVWLLDSERKNYKFFSIAKFFLEQEIDDSFTGSLSKLIPLWEIIKNRITALGLENVWETEEKLLISVISSMEKHGILIDKNWLGKLTKRAEKEINILEKKIYQLSGKEFNISSPKQLSEILFEDLKISSSDLKKTATKKISTNANELLKIRSSHPIIPLIIEYRGIKKLKNSFLDTLPTFINPKTNRIHTIWKQTGTTTGRLSSEKPNLQNIPQKGDWGTQIRKAFVSEKSFSLVSLDYSQIELRLAAHLSGDIKMIEAFNQGKDIHKITSAYINNISEEQVTPSMRQKAKILNFGIIYGMGNKAFAQEAGISLDEAKSFREKYFSNFSGLKNYLDFSLENAKKLGYAETIFGRKRFLPLLGGLGRIARGQERIALNMPIQGLAADIIKIVMIKIQELIKSKYIESDLKILIQVHDELILEAKSEIIKEMSLLFKNIMENAVKLKVPLKVDISIGNKWGEME